MSRFWLIAALLVPVATVAAQAPAAHGALPDGWIGRADEGGDISKVAFVPMSRGWHVTTGPVHAIFYRPDNSASGNYTATLDAFFFGPPGPYPEGYGILVGGKELAAPGQSYLYFVVANNGRYLIKKRSGGTTSMVVDWTPSSAIKTAPSGAGNVENIFQVQARHDSVLFSINHVVVATRSRAELGVDGIVGIRVNHNLSVHVASLTVARAK